MWYSMSWIDTLVSDHEVVDSYVVIMTDYIDDSSFEWLRSKHGRLMPAWVVKPRRISKMAAPRTDHISAS